MTGGLTFEHRKELLSVAYVQAVAAAAGVAVVQRATHDYGVDGALSEISVIDGRRVPSGVEVHYQLKATTRYVEHPDTVVHDLDARTHDMCVQRRTALVPPLLLLVVCLRRDAVEERRTWVRVTPEDLMIAACGYWWLAPAGAPIGNSSSVRIRIPRAQILTPRAVDGLLARSRAGTL